MSLHDGLRGAGPERRPSERLVQIRRNEGDDARDLARQRGAVQRAADLRHEREELERREHQRGDQNRLNEAGEHAQRVIEDHQRREDRAYWSESAEDHLDGEHTEQLGDDQNGEETERVCQECGHVERPGDRLAGRRGADGGDGDGEREGQEAECAGDEAAAHAVKGVEREKDEEHDVDRVELGEPRQKLGQQLVDGQAAEAVHWALANSIRWCIRCRNMSRTGAQGLKEAPALTIRALRPGDLDPLRWVIYRAYFDVLLELYGPDAAQQYEVRSMDFMSLYLRRNAEGCFVAESEDGSIAGGLFCFVWGEVGWFGSLAVAPEWQGRGVGQRLTVRAVEHLREKGCRRIGLETWPALPLTRHLYEKLGFVRCESTLKLSRGIPERGLLKPDRAPHVEWVGTGDVKRLVDALEHLKRVSGLIHEAAGAGEARTDFSEEVRVAVGSGFAELVVLKDARGLAVGCALAYTRKPSGAAVRSLDVRLMLVGGGAEEEWLDALLAALDWRAAELGCRSVTCDVNVRFEAAARALKVRGFREIYELVRMEMPAEGVDVRAKCAAMEFARWAG